MITLKYKETAMRFKLYCCTLMVACTMVLTGCPNGEFMGCAPKCTHTYTVAAGDDCYGTIAEKIYGDWNCWKQLEKANPKVSAADLKPGATLMVPALKGCKISGCKPAKK